MSPDPSPIRTLFAYDGKMRGNGLDLVVQQQLQALSEVGWETDFLSRGQVDLPHIHSRRLGLNPAKLLSFFSSSLYYPAIRRVISARASRMLMPGRHQMVIGWQRAALPLFRKAKEHGIPCILSCASAYAFKPMPGRRWTEWSDEELAEEYRLADCILTPAARTASVYISQGLPKEKVKSIERGYDPSLFFPPEEPPTGFRVLFCGRICERKGPEQLVEGWRAAKLPPDAQLLFAGEIDNELKDWADKSADSQIKFLGFQKDISSLMRTCHVHALLSHTESMGKSLIEAAACGLVNLTTEHVGFPVRHQQTGIIVDRAETESIAKALELLSADVALRDRIRSAAIKEVRENYTWQAFRNRFMEGLTQARSLS
jgi:glycosyltransferase involved in cell wall biosynthesis